MLDQRPNYWLAVGGILYGIFGQIVPGLLIVYGLWLAFKASVLWGIALTVVMPVSVPVAVVLGLGELVLGWGWISPLWPFAAAGVMWATTIGIGVLASVVITLAEKRRRSRA